MGGRFAKNVPGLLLQESHLVGHQILLRFWPLLGTENVDCFEWTPFCGYCQKVGIEVCGVISDNAQNMQSAIDSISTEDGLVSLRCQAHTLNLLLQDVADEFECSVEKVAALQVIRCFECWIYLPCLIGFTKVLRKLPLRKKLLCRR